MNVYRQTARFVLFGLVIASMVFGFQTAATAGVSPEPGGNCATEGAKYEGPPYFVDFTSRFSPPTNSNTNGTFSFTANISSPKDKTCKTSYETTGSTTEIQWNTESSKEAIESICFKASDFEGKFCGYIGDLEVVAVASYSKVGYKVSGRLIVMKLVPR